MRLCTHIVAIAALSLISASAASQQISSGRFASFRELLRERNIELSEPALVNALQNTDPQVRYLAALVLAEDRANDAVPAVSQALSVEKVPETRVNIALALAQLGDDKGLVTLKEACNDPAMPSSLRMYAAKYALDLHDEGCLKAVREVSRSAPDVGARVLALSQLPRFHSTSADESKEIFDSLVASLADREPMIRIAASHALAALGNSLAVPRLQKAMTTEKDDAVRLAMGTDLQRLEGKKTH